MDWLIGLTLLIIGGLGSVLPVLPGPPLSYLALVYLYFFVPDSISLFTLISFGIVTLIITLLDFYFPSIALKKSGGSKSGEIGSWIGMFLGMIFFPPFGIFFGTFIGAYLGEIYEGKSSESARKSAWYTFLGFIIGTFFKLALVAVMTGVFIYSLLKT